MKLGASTFLVAALACARAVASRAAALRLTGDVDDRLSADGAADKKASEDASCWCKALSESLEARSREGTTELRYIGNRKNEREINNKLLRMEVAGHQAQASDHQQSLDSGAAIMGKSQASYEDERVFHEAAISSVRKAMDKIPEGSGGEVRGALRGLEQRFTNNMNEAEEQHEGKFDGLRESKQEMLRLANEAAETKQERISVGEAVVAEAAAEVAAYEARAEADRALGSAKEGLCSALEKGTTERERLRQQAAIALSQEDVEHARTAAAKASARVMLLAGVDAAHGQEPAEEALGRGKELADLLGRITHIEAESTKALSSMVVNGHLAQGSSQVGASVKAAISKLTAEADSDAKTLPTLFSALRSAGAASNQADSALVAVLQKHAKDA